MEMLDIFAEDSCCSRRLSRAIEKKAVQGTTWMCDKCGVEWRSEIRLAGDDDEAVPYRYWYAHCPVALVRAPVRP